MRDSSNQESDDLTTVDSWLERHPKLDYAYTRAYTRFWSTLRTLKEKL